ncbi:uncharacterized protein [Amphiura filiformis]|uniref:uncharacterized protein n=1 Tax=Amphiura filiformis TaxID=82378 RepID=UPI003B227ABD
MPTKPAPEISSPSGIQQSALSCGATSSTSWWKRLKRRFKKNPKPVPVIHKDLAVCDLDEEALKEKFLIELKRRKSFPTVLTYRVPFLKAFRPKTEPENKYSPMEIPDEVFERYFRGQNPWDYAGSPLPFWAPPKV